MIPQYRKGIVREVDGKRGLARVEVQDQDGVVSWWLNVNQELASRSRSYLMPEVGAQVNCLTDERGEEGVILGSFYSDVDVPPTDNAALVKRDLRGGRVETYDKDSGEYHVVQTAKYVIDVGSAHVEIAPDRIVLSVGGVSLTITASGAAFNGGKVSHDGKNIGSSHIHGGVLPGGATTNTPAN